MFSFEGRIRRVEYGITILLYAVFSVFWTLIKIPFFLQSILSILLLWFLLAQGAKRCHDIGKSGWWQIVPFFELWMLFRLLEMPILHSILFIPLIWFLLAQGAKRFHDIGKSGWWQIVPFFVVLWMLFKDGDVGFNEYGEDPKGRIIIKKVPEKILDSEMEVENNEEASNKN